MPETLAAEPNQSSARGVSQSVPDPPLVLDAGLDLTFFWAVDLAFCLVRICFLVGFADRLVLGDGLLSKRRRRREPVSPPNKMAPRIRLHKGRGWVGVPKIVTGSKVGLPITMARPIPINNSRSMSLIHNIGLNTFQTKSGQ